MFESYAGQLTLNLGAGNQSIVGVGFTPKLTIFMSNAEDVNEINTHWHCNFGAAISAAAQFSLRANSEDGQAVSAGAVGYYINECIGAQAVGVAVNDYVAAFVSNDADGFTINISNPPAFGVEVAYICLGGDDLTNVAIGSFQANLAPGNQAIAGVGFKPDALIFAALSGWTLQNVMFQSDAFINFGFADGDGNEGALSVFSDNGVTPSNTTRYQRTTNCYSSLRVAGLDSEATHISMDADGFTIDWTIASGTADWINYIALRGGRYQVGTFDSLVALGDIAVTGLGFRPQGGVFASVCNPTAAGVQAHNEISLGFVSQHGDMMAMGGTDEDNVNPTAADRWMYPSLYRNYDFAQNLQGEVDLASWDNDGFTAEQVDADPAANEIIYLTFGPTPSSPSSSSYRIALGDPDESFVEFPDAPRIHHEPGDPRWDPPAFP